MTKSPIHFKFSDFTPNYVSLGELSDLRLNGGFSRYIAQITWKL